MKITAYLLLTLFSLFGVFAQDTIVKNLSALSADKKECPKAKYYLDDPATVTAGNLVMDSLSAFIKYKYHQPASVRSEFKNFTLRLNCIIDTGGKVVCPEIPVSSVHPDIAGEIYRILGLFRYDAGSKKPFSITLELPYDENGFHENNIHNTIFNVVQQMPRFNSKGTIRQYIEAELKAASCACTGRVRVDFVVEKDGSVSQVELRDGVGDCEECFQKIETILSSCPKWIPGKMRNNPVRVRLATFVSLTNRQ